MFYIILMPLNFLISLLCYLTNPIVCLFANEVGELPGILKYWQTWDNSCDVEFFVVERVPNIFRYDFKSKYITGVKTTPELEEVGRSREFVQLIPGATFSFKEKVKRYFCRVLWLTRNNAYGFAFYFFGKNIKGTDTVRVKNIKSPIEGENEFRFAYDKSKSILVRPWILYIDKKINDRFYWNVFLGWKIDTDNTTEKIERAMIANRISIRQFDK